MSHQRSARDEMDRIRSAVDAVRERSSRVPRTGIILGTGLGALAEQIDEEVSIPYEAIPGMPEPTVETHSGRLILGELGGASVAAFQGRFHRYEGWDLRDIVLPVRILRLLGAENLVVSGACGCMNPLWEGGDLVLLDDHINLLGDNPLIGENLEELGDRFPDMSEPYDRELQELTQREALRLDVPLRRGVYVAVLGPNLETRAEYRMLRAMGADVVGMSTVPEVIAARHAGLRVLGVTIVTDMCLPDALEPANVEEIIRTAREAEPHLARLLGTVVPKI